MIAVPHSIVLDAQALSLYAESSAAMYPWIAAALRTNSTLHISTVTLAETTDGTARDANVRRVVKNMNRIHVSESIAYEAGRLRAKAIGSRRKPRDVTIDALVASTALSLRPPVIVLTSDEYDMTLLLEGTGVHVYKVGSSRA